MPKTKGHLVCCGALGLIALSCSAGSAVAQVQDGSLERGFKDPPESAKPRTWWHWTSGNVTKEGITKDLEWMKRVGIGGMHLADVAAGGGQTVEKRIIFGTPEWLDAVRYAAAEADRLGLEMSIFSSAGWSETGGPWVKPEQAMKKFVWSETNVAGPQHFKAQLPQPPTNNGPIGNWSSGSGARGGADPTWYGDSAVIAYRTPADEAEMAELKPRVTTANGAIDGNALVDDDLNSAVTITAPAGGGPAWVQFEFDQPFKSRAMTIAGRAGIPVGRLLTSDDGVAFQTLVVLPGTQQYRQGRVRTYAFPETTAKIYRLEMTGAPLGPEATMNQDRPQPAARYSLSEFKLHSGARVHRWQEKAGFSFCYEYEAIPTPVTPQASAILRADIVDLTSKMAPDGTLDWDIPAGQWTILRLGYSLTGAKNRPAPPSGLGYEVDKLSRKHVEAYYHGYFDPIAQALGPLFGKSLRYVMMDSWEAGTQNWTEQMLGEFQRRRGYDPAPYLPALTGHVVESAEVSDRFLWDFRRTIADLLADNHYGTMAELLRQRGLGISAEAAGVSMEIMEDTLLNKSKVEIPMGEFWVRALHPELQYYVDVRGAASAAHAYGKKLVGAEAFTGGGYEAPFTLKQIGDYWSAQGVNRIVFHTSAHQPLDTKPGNTMVGTHINRNITWAEQARPFMTYLARVSFMLQRGLFVADLAYLLPEGVPASQPFWGAGIQPPPPQGYDYDCINTDVLLHRLSVNAEGRLVLPDGMSYRLLVLPQSERMTPPVLRKIRELVAGGATIVGPRLVLSPSLTDYPRADKEVQALVADVWGDLDGVTRDKRFYGKGLVVWGLPLQDVLNSLAVPKDFEFSRGLDTELVWIHRRAGDEDFYFAANRTDHPQAIQARFRVTGKAPQLWHPDTGAIEPADYTIGDGRTTVRLQLAERESLFVVFRPSVPLVPSVPSSNGTRAVLATVSGSWAVTFPPGLGAPEEIQLSKLESWTANTNDGVRYFSGTATYTRTLQAPKSWFQPGSKILLDFGAVKDLIEVWVNGNPLGTLWKPPYEMDVTGALKSGENRLELKVTNQWTNRLMGDRAVPPEKRVLAASAGGAARPGSAPRTLPDAGLIGPVTVVSSP